MLSKTGCVCCVCGMRQPRAAVGGRHSPAQFLWLGSRYVACNRGCPGSCTLHLAHGCTRRWQHSQRASPDLVLYSGSPSQHRSCCAMPCATVLLTMWHSPAAAGREAWLGWMQCSLSPLAIQAPQDLCLLPSWEGPVPHLPSLLLCPTLVSPSPRAHQCLLWLCLLTGLGAAGPAPPAHGPSLARLSGCITSPTAIHMPPALALLLPRVSLLSPHCVATSAG